MGAVSFRSVKDKLNKKVEQKGTIAEESIIQQTSKTSRSDVVFL
jgi:hypothetical protein